MGIKRSLKRSAHIVAALVVAFAGFGGASPAHAIGEACTTPFTTTAISNLDSNSALVKAGDGAMWIKEAGNTSKLARTASDGTVTEFAIPSSTGGIAVGSDGNIWFTDTNSSQPELSHITSDGTVTSVPLATGGTTVSMMTLGSDGVFWGANRDGNGNWTVEKIATDGTVAQYPITTSPASPYSTVNGFVSGPDGNIWLGYNGNGIPSLNQILRVNVSDGSMTWFSWDAQEQHDLRSMTVGSDGALWYTLYDQNTDQGALGRMTTDGTHTQYTDARLNHIGAPAYITSGSDGNLWFTTGNGLGRFTLSSHAIENYSLQVTADGAPSFSTVGSGSNAMWVADYSHQTISKLDLSNLPALATPQNFATSQNAYTPDFSWQAVSGATSYIICRDGTVIGTSTNGYNDTEAGEGNHYYVVLATDNAGHMSSPSTGIEMIVDRAAPTLGTPTLSNNPMLAGQTSKLSVNATDTSGIASVQMVIDGTTSIPLHKASCGIGCNSSPDAWEFNFPTDTVDCGVGCTTHYTFNQQGVHSIVITATDGVGRQSAPQTISFTIGLVPPTSVAVVKSPTNSAPVLNWNAVPGADHYAIYRDGGSTPISTSMTPSYTDSASLADGTHTYTVTTADASNNESTQSSPVSVVVDKTAPVASSPAVSPTTIFFTGTLSISANATDALSGIAGGEYYIDTDPGQGNGTAMTYSASTGKLTASRSVSNGAFSIGTHTVYMRAKDAAGNWSATVSKTFRYI